MTAPISRVSAAPHQIVGLGLIEEQHAVVPIDTDILGGPLLAARLLARHSLTKNRKEILTKVSVGSSGPPGSRSQHIGSRSKLSTDVAQHQICLVKRYAECANAC
jgi:hypothetical protein